MGEKDDTKKGVDEKVVDDTIKGVNEKKAVDANVTKKVDEGPNTIVLKLDLHCDGCAKKVKKSIRYIEGVQSVKADSSSNKLTITGKVNPVHIKERVEYKTKKKVEIISPKPKKDEESESKASDKLPEARSDDQKPKEPQSTTVLLKIPLHCDGCIQKIKRIILKIDGVDSVKLDGNTNLVTVKGTMNMKELIPYLKDKLKRNVDIVPPKKEENKVDEKKDEKKAKGSDDKKEKDGDNDGDNKKKNDAENTITNSEDSENKKNDEAKAASSGDEKNKSNDKAKTTGGGDGDGDGDESKKKDVSNKFEYYKPNDPGYIYTMPIYNQNYHNQDYDVPVYLAHGYENEGFCNHGYTMGYRHGPPPPPSPMSIHDARASESDIFSAENPHACSIM